jgi:phage-related protein
MNDDNFDDIDLDTDDDFGDFGDDGDDFGDFGMSNEPPPKDTREAVSRGLRDGRQSFKEEFTSNPGKAGYEVVKHAIPSNLKPVVSGGEEIVGEFNNIIDEGLKEVKGPMKTIISPFEESENAIVRKVTGGIKKLFRLDEEDHQSHEESIEEKATNFVKNIMPESESPEALATMLNAKTTFEQSKKELDVLHKIYKEASLGNQYNFNISNTVARKSLELQFRSTLATEELLDLTKTGFDTFKGQMEGVIKNTSLPDYVKITMSEQIQQGLFQKLFSGNSELFGVIKENLIEKATDLKDKFVSGVGMGEQIAGAGEMGGSVGTMAGSMVADAAKSYGGGFIGKQLDKTSFGRRANSIAQEYAIDTSDKFKAQAEESENFVKKSVFNFLADITSASGSATRGEIQKFKGDDVALFDNKTQISITKIIPSYLAKIHQELASMRSGSMQEELRYDVDSDRLVRRSNIKDDFTKRVETQLDENDSIRNGLENLVKDLVSTGGLQASDEELKEIKRNVMLYTLSGKSLLPSRLDVNGFYEAFDGDLKTKFKDSIDKYLSTGDDEEQDTRYRALSDTLSTIRKEAPSVDEIVKSYVDSGNADVLEEHNIINYDSKTRTKSINYDNYIDMLSESISNVKPEEPTGEVIEPPEIVESQDTTVVQPSITQMQNEPIISDGDNNGNSVCKTVIEKVNCYNTSTHEQMQNNGIVNTSNVGTNTSVQNSDVVETISPPTEEQTNVVEITNSSTTTEPTTTITADANVNEVVNNQDIQTVENEQTNQSLREKYVAKLKRFADKTISSIPLPDFVIRKVNRNVDEQTTDILNADNDEQATSIFKQSKDYIKNIFKINRNNSSTPVEQPIDEETMRRSAIRQEAEAITGENKGLIRRSAEKVGSFAGSVVGGTAEVAGKGALGVLKGAGKTAGWFGSQIFSVYKDGERERELQMQRDGENISQGVRKAYIRDEIVKELQESVITITGNIIKLPDKVRNIAEKGLDRVDKLIKKIRVERKLDVMRKLRKRARDIIDKLLKEAGIANDGVKKIRDKSERATGEKKTALQKIVAIGKGVKNFIAWDMKNGKRLRTAMWKGMKRVGPALGGLAKGSFKAAKGIGRGAISPLMGILDAYKAYGEDGLATALKVYAQKGIGGIATNIGGGIKDLAVDSGKGIYETGKGLAGDVVDGGKWAMKMAKKLDATTDENIQRGLVRDGVDSENEFLSAQRTAASTSEYHNAYLTRNNPNALEQLDQNNARLLAQSEELQRAIANGEDTDAVMRRWEEEAPRNSRRRNTESPIDGATNTATDNIADAVIDRIEESAINSDDDNRSMMDRVTAPFNFLFNTSVNSEDGEIPISQEEKSGFFNVKIDVLGGIKDFFGKAITEMDTVFTKIKDVLPSKKDVEQSNEIKEEPPKPSENIEGHSLLDNAKGFLSRQYDNAVDVKNDVVKKSGEMLNTGIETVTKLFKSAVSTLTSFSGTFVTTVKDLFTTVTTFVTDKVKSGFTYLKDKFKSTGEFLSKQIETVTDKLTNPESAFVKSLKSIGDNISKGVGKVKTFASDQFEHFTGEDSPIIKGFNKVKESVTESFKSISDYTTEKFKTVSEFATGKFETISKTITDAWGKYTSAESPIFKTFDKVKDTITDKFENISNFTTVKFQTITDFASNKFDNISESVKENWSKLTTAITNVNDKFKDNLNSVSDFITSKFETVQNFIKEQYTNLTGEDSIISSTFNKVKDSTINTFNKVSEKVTEQYNNLKDTATEHWTKLKTTLEESDNMFLKSLNNVSNYTSEKFEQVSSYVKEQYEFFSEQDSPINAVYQSVKSNTISMFNSAKDSMVEQYTKLENSATEKWEKLKTRVEESDNKFINSFKTVGEHTTKTFNDVKDFATKQYKEITSSDSPLFTAFDKVKTTVSENYNKLESSAKEKWDNIAKQVKESDNRFLKSFNKIGEVATEKFALIQNTVKEQYTNITSSESPFKTAFSKVSEFTSKQLDSITSTTKDKFDSIKTSLTDTDNRFLKSFKSIKDSITDTYDDVKAKGKALYSDIADDLTHHYSDLKTFISNSVDAVTNSETAKNVKGAIKDTVSKPTKSHALIDLTYTNEILNNILSAIKNTDQDAITDGPSSPIALNIDDDSGKKPANNTNRAGSWQAKFAAQQLTPEKQLVIESSKHTEHLTNIEEHLLTISKNTDKSKSLLDYLKIGLMAGIGGIGLLLKGISGGISNIFGGVTKMIGTLGSLPNLLISGIGKSILGLGSLLTGSIGKLTTMFSKDRDRHNNHNSSNNDDDNRGRALSALETASELDLSRSENDDNDNNRNTRKNRKRGLGGFFGSSSDITTGNTSNSSNNSSNRSITTSTPNSSNGIDEVGENRVKNTSTPTLMSENRAIYSENPINTVHNTQNSSNFSHNRSENGQNSSILGQNRANLGENRLNSSNNVQNRGNLTNFSENPTEIGTNRANNGQNSSILTNNGQNSTEIGQNRSNIGQNSAETIRESNNNGGNRATNVNIGNSGNNNNGIDSLNSDTGRELRVEERSRISDNTNSDVNDSSNISRETETRERVNTTNRSSRIDTGSTNSLNSQGSIRANIDSQSISGQNMAGNSRNNRVIGGTIGANSVENSRNVSSGSNVIQENPRLSQNNSSRIDSQSIGTSENSGGRENKIDSESISRENRKPKKELSWWERQKEKISGAFDKVKSGAKSIGGMIYDNSPGFVKKIGSSFKTGWNKTKEFMKSAGETIKRGASKVFGAMNEKINQLLSGVGLPTLGEMLEKAKSVAGKVKSYLSSKMGKSPNAVKLVSNLGISSAAKKVPVLGLASAGYAANERKKEGDNAGAGLELASGVAGSVPGLGSLASTAIDGLLMYRDLTALEKAEKSGDTRAVGKVLNRSNNGDGDSKVDESYVSNNKGGALLLAGAGVGAVGLGVLSADEIKQQEEIEAGYGDGSELSKKPLSVNEIVFDKDGNLDHTTMVMQGILNNKLYDASDVTYRDMTKAEMDSMIENGMYLTAAEHMNNVNVGKIETDSAKEIQAEADKQTTKALEQKANVTDLGEIKESDEQTEPDSNLVNQALAIGSSAVVGSAIGGAESKPSGNSNPSVENKQHQNILESANNVNPKKTDIVGSDSDGEKHLTKDNNNPIQPPKEESGKSVGSVSSMPTAFGALEDPTGGKDNLKLNKSNIDVTSFNPAFTNNLYGMANEYNKLTGKKILITSGYRSTEEQQKLYDKYGPGRAAKPGRSLHEFGLAVDINTAHGNELEKLGLMRKYGFTRPVGGETWHVEPAGINIGGRELIAKVKQDPELASKLTRESVGHGGGGQGLESGVRKYSRNYELAKKVYNAGSDIAGYSGTDSNGNLTKNGDNNPQAKMDKLMEQVIVKAFNPKGADAKLPNGAMSAPTTSTISQGTMSQPSEPTKVVSQEHEAKPSETNNTGKPETTQQPTIINNNDPANQVVAGNTGKTNEELATVNQTLSESTNMQGDMLSEMKKLNANLSNQSSGNMGNINMPNPPIAVNN